MIKVLNLNAKNKLHNFFCKKGQKKCHHIIRKFGNSPRFSVFKNQQDQR